MLWNRRWGGLTVSAAIALLACSSGESDGEPAQSEGPRVWSGCTGGTTRCECVLHNPGWVMSGLEKRACPNHQCCLLTDNPNVAVAALCECAVSWACEMAAAERPGARMVDSCPPSGDTIVTGPGTCALHRENCGQEYLSEYGLQGCCAGLECVETETHSMQCQEQPP